MPKPFSMYEIINSFIVCGVALDMHQIPQITYEGRVLRFKFDVTITSQYAQAINLLQDDWNKRWDEYEQKKEQS